MNESISVHLADATKLHLPNGLCSNRRETIPLGQQVGTRSIAVDSAAEMIRRTGARATPARVRVLEALRQAHGPLTHGELEKALGGSEIDRVTLYRVLDWLCHSGLATRNPDAQRVFRFSMSEPGDHGRHVHFCCETCGGVFCLDELPPSPPVLPPGFSLRHANYNLRGSCARCSDSTASSVSGGASEPRR